MPGLYYFYGDNNNDLGLERFSAEVQCRDLCDGYPECQYYLWIYGYGCEMYTNSSSPYYAGGGYGIDTYVRDLNVPCANPACT